MSVFLRTIGIWAALAGGAMAQAPTTSERVRLAAEAASQPATTTLLDLWNKAGPSMYPMAALSFIAVGLVLLYAFTVRPGAVVNQSFMDLSETLIQRQDYLALVAACNRSNLAVARVMQRAMEFATRSQGVGLEEVREVAQAEGIRQANLLTRRISYLSDVAALAPMVGLLGTVLGMIRSFNSVSDGTFTKGRQMELAQGVSEALINTASGLIVCVFAMAFYAVFRGKTQKLIADLEATATHLMALFSVAFQASQRGPGRGTPVPGRGHEPEPMLDEPGPVRRR